MQPLSDPKVPERCEVAPTISVLQDSVERYGWLLGGISPGYWTLPKIACCGLANSRVEMDCLGKCPEIESWFDDGVIMYGVRIIDVMVGKIILLHSSCWRNDGCIYTLNLYLTPLARNQYGTSTSLDWPRKYGPGRPLSSVTYLLVAHCTIGHV